MRRLLRCDSLRLKYSSIQRHKKGPGRSEPPQAACTSMWKCYFGWNHRESGSGAVWTGADDGQQNRFAFRLGHQPFELLNVVHGVTIDRGDYQSASDLISRRTVRVNIGDHHAMDVRR